MHRYRPVVCSSSQLSLRAVIGLMCAVSMVAGLGSCSDDKTPSDPATAPTSSPSSDTAVDGDGSPPTTQPALATGDSIALEAEEGTPVRGGSLVLAINADPGVFDPIDGQLALQGHYAASAVFDTLAQVNSDGLVVPYLATSIEHNDTATEWRIGVPEGVVFHDGTALTPEVVAANLVARRDSATGSFTLPLLDEVTIDGQTVVVSLTEPWIAFDLVLTQQLGYVLSTSMLEGGEEMVGTGPFRLREYRSGETVLLDRFDQYWRTDEAGVQLPYLDELEMRIMAAPPARKAAFETGQVDALITISASDLVEYLDAGDVDVVVDDASEELVLTLNAAKPPLDDLEVRDALTISVDRVSLNALINDDLLTIANGPFGPGEFWYDPDHGYPEYDPERAAAIVTEWEAENGEDLAVVLSYPAGGEGEEMVTLIAEMWESVGISVGVDPIEQTSFITSLVFGETQITSQANFGWVDPDFLYLFLHSDTAALPGEGIGVNFSYTINDDLDAALERGRASLDRDERREAYGDMVRIMNQERAYVFLFHRVVGLVGKPEVNGLYRADQIGFGNISSKPWLADLWMSPG